MTPEGRLQNAIRLALSEVGVITWRNNVGALKDENGRLVRYGPCKGSSDIIGIKSVKVTPAMVGGTVGIFCALEVKTPTGRPTKAQLQFIKAIKDAGGIAEVVRSEEEAISAVRP